MKSCWQITLGIALLLLAACSSPEKPPYATKVGKPYQVYGHRYEPAYEPHYDEIGTASWYGPGFHGGKTANGERYDQNALTAAHRTLPLPSIVRVTNLDNGRSAVIRINDRGPFAHNRIIDLSKACAVRLGMIGKGTAKVRVQFLDRETKEYVENMQRGSAPYDVAETPATPPASMIPPQTGALPWQQEQTAAASATLQVVANNAVYSNTDPNADPQPAETPDTFSVIDDAHASTEGASTEGASREADATEPNNRETSKGFFVQAGTFSLQDNARRLLSKLSGIGSSQMTEVMIHQKRFYRVMMGPYSLQQDARNMLSKLAAVGISDAKIIRN